MDKIDTLTTPKIIIYDLSVDLIQFLSVSYVRN
jgi:hypothetical protein